MLGDEEGDQIAGEVENLIYRKENSDEDLKKVGGRIVARFGVAGGGADYNLTQRVLDIVW